MKEIPLTQGQVALVDDADYDWLMTMKWHAWRPRRTGIFYARTSFWSPRPGTKCMHQYLVDTPAGMEIDHIDRNGLNNQRHNLRAVPRWVNLTNRGMNRRNSSGFRGVCRSDGCESWRAQLSVQGKSLHLGNFPTPEEAARAYDAAAIEYRGEYTLLNFPEEVDS